MSDGGTPIVVHCHDCGRCYESRQLARETRCPFCRRVTPLGTRFLEPVRWMPLEEVACRLDLVEIDRTKMRDCMFALNLHGQVELARFDVFIASLPVTLCVDLELHVANRRLVELRKAGAHCELIFLPYSSRCCLRLESAAAITSKLIKTVSVIRQESVMVSRKWLASIPGILRTDIDIPTAQRFQRQLREAGAVATLEYHSVI